MPAESPRLKYAFACTMSGHQPHVSRSQLSRHLIGAEWRREWDWQGKQTHPLPVLSAFWPCHRMIFAWSAEACTPLCICLSRLHALSCASCLYLTSFENPSLMYPKCGWQLLWLRWPCQSHCFLNLGTVSAFSQPSIHDLSVMDGRYWVAFS